MVSCRGSDKLQVWSYYGSVWSRVRSGRVPFVQHTVRFRAFSCFVLSCSVWHAAGVFHRLHAFMFVMSCVNTRLMSLLISCVFMSRFAHA